MVEGFLVVLQLATEVAHPVDVELSRAHIEGSGVEPLAKGLSLRKTVENAVHRHLCLEFLIGRSNTFHYVLYEVLCFRVPLPSCLLNSSLILESTTG